MNRDLLTRTSRELQHAPGKITDAADEWSAKVGSGLGTFVKRHALIGCILLLALLLRCQELRQPLIDAFSWRQASTAMMADNYYRTDFNIFFPEVSWTGAGPNYQGREFQLVTWSVSILYRIFGQEEWFGRAVGAIAGTWGVFALFMLAQRVWSRQAAYWVALMLATLPGAIFIDRSFLPDPTMLALTITATWLYVDYLCTRRRRTLLAFGIVGTLAWLTKLPGIISLVPMIYATVVVLRRERRLNFAGLWPILLTLGCMLVPIISYYCWAVYLGTHYPPYHIAGSSNWVWKDGLGKWIDQWYFIPQIMDGAWYWLWTAPFIALIVLGIIHFPPGGRVQLISPEERLDDPPPARRTTDKPERTLLPWFFHFWFLGCSIIYIIGARELRENQWNLHVFNVFAAAMAGNGLYRISQIASEKVSPLLVTARTVAIALVAMIFGQIVIAPAYANQGMQSYRLGQALERVSQPGDLVATIAHDVGDPIAIYYSHRRGYVFPPAHMPKTWKPFNLIPDKLGKNIYLLEDLRSRNVKWLGIVNDPRDDTPGSTNFWNDHPEFVSYINKTCEFVEKTSAYVIYRIKTPEELGKPRKPPVEDG